MANCKICGKHNPGRKNYCGNLRDPNSCYHKHSVIYKRQYKLKHEKKVTYRRPPMPKREGGNWALQWLNCY